MTDHVSHLFASAVAAHPARIATRVRDGDRWRTQTYAELDHTVHATARALLAAGVERGDRVAIFAANSPEWTEVDLATMLVGAVPVPIYATSTPEQLGHIVNDSGARLLFAGGASELDRVRRARTPNLERLVTLGETGDDHVPSLRGVRERAEARTDLDATIAARFADAAPDDLAGLVYTSGTTGGPKGVMLSHGALVSQVRALDSFFVITPDDHSLCFLPLSHALERAWTTVVLSHGCMNTYVPNARDVADLMVLARPTMMVSVPKLYERVFATAKASVAASPAKQRVFDWALHVGARVQRARRDGRTPPPHLAVQHALADRLVFAGVRTAMGGPKTVLACGGAPLRPEVEEFFAAVGLPILQGYGLTEAGPLISFNAPDAVKVGTVGRVMPGGEVRIGRDSEIQYRGPNVMTGYWNDPEATAAAFDDGWLRTGDVGHVDDDGFLVITDRIKDIIVTIGGKNVSPQPIEGLLLADPLFEQAVLLGDNRPCLTLLVKPSLPHLHDLAHRLGVSAGSPDELLAHPAIVEELHRRVQHLTQRLPSHEQIRDIRLLRDDFTMDNGLLTPTLKVKRREVERRFQHLIDEMYSRIAERRGR
ncbi:MAG TPA: long-chain fatty acid--CoA ligase [Propionibacteriaceae bacterium]|nr:long-chain fatty acid--CoA ligase [Propionibacteriaceae bacterium]